MLKHDQIEERQDVDASTGNPRAHPRPFETRNPPPSRGGHGDRHLCVVLFVGLLWAVHYYRASSAAKAAAAARSMIPEVPVIEGKVQQKDVPIYLDGLGTVRPITW